MSHYEYQTTLRDLYQKGMGLYRGGSRDPGTWLDIAEQACLASIGARVQELYDFVDDGERYGEPDYETFVLIMAVRREFFLVIQKGVHDGAMIDPSSLPAKTDEVRGIAWLPRLMSKARARLRGELPDSLMYCCGGDRQFFRTHDIHPAEFLRATWAFRDDDRLVAWVESRSKARPG